MCSAWVYLTIASVITGRLHSIKSYLLFQLDKTRLLHVTIQMNYQNIVAIKSLSHVQLFATPWTAACQAPLSSTLWSLLKFTSIESVMLSNYRILCHPFLLLPSIFPSIRVFSNELAFPTRWPKYWSFGFSSSPSNEYSGLISCRMDWFDILVVQGTLKSLLQHHSSKASILQHSPSLWSKAEEKSQMAKCLMGLFCLGKWVTYQSWST